MEIVIENPTSELSSSTTSLTATTSTNATSPSNPNMYATLPSQNRAYRYVANDPIKMQNIDYYRTLQTSRSRHISPEPHYETNVPIPTSVKRVDRSGLLEIAEPEPAQRSSTRNRHMTGVEPSGHPSGTLTRRIDRSGLLEAVPELPDQCPNWRNEKSTPNTKLTAAENIDLSQKSVSPRNSRSTPVDSSRKPEVPITPEETDDKRERATEKCGTPVSQTSIVSATITSPYLRRYPGSPTSKLERPTPVLMVSTDRDTTILRNRNSFTGISTSGCKFTPIDAPKTRQSYVDLTGATYTRSPIATSPNGSRTSAESTQTNFCDIDISKRQQQPDCLGRLSPRSRGDRQSPLTMSSVIPDVIEAHGSRSNRDVVDDDAPDGPRIEAEGCEHTAIESLEDNRVTFKASNKILHNDNIQTLRVIILSEQL